MRENSNKEKPTGVHSTDWKLLSRTFHCAYWKQPAWGIWSVHGGGWCSVCSSVLAHVTSIQPGKHGKHWLWSKLLHKQDHYHGWWSCTSAKMVWQNLVAENNIKCTIYCALQARQKLLQCHRLKQNHALLLVRHQKWRTQDHRAGEDLWGRTCDQMLVTSFLSPLHLSIFPTSVTYGH